ncbi:MAG: hypothetical protein H6948_03340 [Zoogloeaceae bacterium]|nr:hypothetical protein [Zoogloeaceae bacterium]
MMNLIKPRTALILALALAPAVAWSANQDGDSAPVATATGHAGHGGQMGGMRHANPMPNLMQVVVKMGDQLNLSEEQSAELAKWREEHMTPMHGTVDELVRMEAELNKAALEGASRARLLGMYSDIAQIRRDIVSTKIACRDNMKRVLSEEQFNKVITLYTAQF